MLCPSLQVRWHFLHSLDLHHPIPSPFRPDESSQNVNPVHILHPHYGSAASPHGDVPFKHICGYITLYTCVSGHQIILKYLQFTNHIRMDNSITCLILPAIATPIHWTDTSIYTLIHSSGTLIYTNSLIISFLALSSLQVGAFQAPSRL